MTDDTDKDFRTNALACAEAYRLHISGYCPISNKHGMASRLDREDWKEALAETHVNGMEWVNCIGDNSAADYYRRGPSKDVIYVKDPAVYDHLRRLNREAGIGYGWGCWSEYRPLYEDVLASAIQAAVSLARKEQIKDTGTLRRRVVEEFPETKDVIDEALTEWANREVFPKEN